MFVLTAAMPLLLFFTQQLYAPTSGEGEEKWYPPESSEAARKEWDEWRAAAQKEREKEEEYERNRVLSPHAASLKNIFEKLKKNPTSSTLQAEYLKHFPKNRKDFDAMFGFKMDAPRFEDAGELYRSGNYYIGVLENFNRRYMTYICKISLDIAKDSSVFEVDRYGEFGCMMESLLFKHTEIFRKKLFLLSPSERSSAMRFMIKYASYSNDFPDFISKLRKNGDWEFIAVFSDAIKWGTEVDMGCSCVLLPPDATSYITNMSSDTHGECENHKSESAR
ncbi:MAG: hypothetical protein QME32_01490 [Endomicrobiia bacterium]|nr:hypothetical protein [Endomicrobiia bacterium]